MKIAEILLAPPVRRTLMKKRLVVKRILHFQPETTCDCFICTKHQFEDGGIITYIKAHMGYLTPRSRVFYCHSHLDEFIFFLVNHIGWDPKDSLVVYDYGTEMGEEDVMIQEWVGELRDFLPEAE